MSIQTSTVAGAPRCSLGEGPAWHAGTLHWIDINEGQIWTLAGKDNTPQAVYQAEDTIGCIIPRSQRGWVAGVGHQLVFLDAYWDVEYTIPLPIDAQTERINDGKADPHGRLFIGTMARDASDKKGHLFRIDADKEVHTLLSQTGISNGLDWSLDEHWFYFIDSLRQSVMKFGYDTATGAIENPTTLCEIPASLGAPDGMTLDNRGNLHVCLWGGSGILPVDTNTGNFGEILKLDAPHITCCTFSDSGTLYVTSASCALSETELKQIPQAGKLFKINNTGLKAARETSTTQL